MNNSNAEIRATQMSKVLRKYILLSFYLHELIRNGRGESSDAEDIRELMDEPGFLLSPEEILTARGISSDFYSLDLLVGDLSRSVLKQAAQPPSLKVLRDLAGAVQAKDRGEFVRAFDLLRAHKSKIHPGDLAYLRSCIWYDAGELAIAREFRTLSSKISVDIDLMIGSRNYLQRWARGADGPGGHRKPEKKQNEYQREVYSLECIKIVIKYMIKLCESFPAGTPTLDACDEILEIMRPVLSEIDYLDVKMKASIEIVGAFMVLGLCCECLGRFQEAVSLYDKALEIFPSNGTILLMKSIALHEGGDEGSQNSFVLAKSRSAPAHIVYLYMANEYYVKGNDVACLQCCHLAMKYYRERTEILSHIVLWMAVSQASLFHPVQIVEPLFEFAIKLSEDNGNACENLRIYKENLNGASLKYVRNAFSVPVSDEFRRTGLDRINLISDALEKLEYSE